MTPPRNRYRRRQGFTLVELLTVVGIIALLISILLPSLANARKQAKRAAVRAQLKAIEDDLEMFHNEFDMYPESKLRIDPIIDWPNLTGTGAPPDGAWLSGAHWLARALSGHDLQGVDSGGVTLRDGAVQSVKYNQLRDVDPDTGLPGIYSERKRVFLDKGELFAKDDDSSRFKKLAPVSDAGRTGRLLVVDGAFGSPVLYYKANTKVKPPFSLDGLLGTPAQGTDSDYLGIYNHQDNLYITGYTQLLNDTVVTEGWDFAMTNQRHNLAKFGGLNLNPSANDFIGKFPGSFTHTLHDHGTHEAVDLLKPHRRESFVLITAGPDSIYGTDDDVNNFKTGL